MSFYKDAKFWISLIFILPAWITVWVYHSSNTHMVLSTNILTGVAAYWLGSSKGSDDKNKLFGGKQYEAPKPETSGVGGSAGSNYRVSIDDGASKAVG
jgi:hypothetical protein